MIKMSLIEKTTKSVADEFNGDEKKIVDMFLKDGNPSFNADENFKKKLDSKISEKIGYECKQMKDVETMNSIPKRLKWRMYLTGYGYAVVSFVALFLIGFCTNIFTGTIKLPTKYNRIENAHAFGNVSDLGNIENESYVNLDYASDDGEYDQTFLDDKENLVETKLKDSKSIVLSKLKSDTIVKTNGNNITSVDSKDDNLLGGYNVFDKFLYDKTYRFSYKSKLFPKLSENYPVYKVDGTLITYSTPKQIFKNLKIGGVSLKNFSNLEMERFEMSEMTENGYTILFDNRTQKLSFYPNESWKAGDFQGTLPSKKKIIKAVEKELKLLGISLKDYGEGEVNVDDFDGNMGIIQIFYPFKLQGKDVRNAGENRQIGMDIAYDLNLQKIVYINNIDIAKYQISDYSVVDKSILEDKIEQGGSYFSQGALHEYSTIVMLDSMEVVYLEKITDDGNILYIPAIKATVSTSLENYEGPNMIFQELI